MLFTILREFLLIFGLGSSQHGDFFLSQVEHSITEPLRSSSLQYILSRTTVYNTDTETCMHISFRPPCEKTCLQGFANNTDADQVQSDIRFLESIIYNLLQVKFQFSS